MGLEALRARLTELVAANEAIMAAAAEAARDMTDDENGKIDANLEEIDRVNASIARLERVAAAATPGQRQVPQGNGTLPNAGGRPSVPAAPKTDARTMGFRHMGEFAHAVKAAGAGDSGAAGRLQAAANEGTGSEGGFLVPPQFRDAIWQKVAGEGSLMSRCDMVTLERNELKVPKDETTPWGSAGLQVYWEGEAAQATASTPSLEATTVRLNKLMGLVRVSDEILEDAASLDVYLRSRAPIVIGHRVSSAIIAGNGVGKPLGILSSDARVTVAKETSQPADTVFHRNIVKMWSRMYADCRANAVWLINQDVEPQLHTMSFRDVGSYPSTATGTAVPVYVPAGGVSGSPYASLMGRPVIPAQGCKTVGDEGDIILADLSQYLIAQKAGGVRTDVSMHLYFDYGQQAYRFTFRLAGLPWWNNTVTPENGTNSLAPFVTLAAR
jgi:HK97 family phage major capsid protein